jgi:hypothetical protein
VIVAKLNRLSRDVRFVPKADIPHFTQSPRPRGGEQRRWDGNAEHAGRSQRRASFFEQSVARQGD